MNVPYINELKKLTIPQLKSKIEEMGVEVPSMGTGRQNKLLKKDIIDFIAGLPVKSPSIFIENVNQEICSHPTIIEDNNGTNICKECGDEIEIYDFSPEWRYYGNSDSKCLRDPSRCGQFKINNNNLSKVFDELNIKLQDVIKERVELKYQKVSGGKTYRGKGRKAIIAVCLFHAYKEFNQCRTTDYIRKLFDLSKKHISEGLTIYYDVFKEDRNQIIRPEDLLKWILDLTGISEVHYNKILKMANYLSNKSSIFKRSSPQSVASAIVYFWLCLNPDYKSQLNLTKSKFAEKTELSDITITKLVREASNITNMKIDL